jgi:predicted 3-demethylubiquinone-9 3-methyltransferase (glyoxalase superfamily)
MRQKAALRRSPRLMKKLSTNPPVQCQCNADPARTSHINRQCGIAPLHCVSSRAISRMQTITPMLWFDNQVEEAANFYVSVFKNSKVKQITHYAGEEFPEKKGQVMTVSFELNGQEFTALNGGPDFKFTEAVSFVINCDTQEEIDYYWEKLTAGGGKEVECGWVADKYGLSRQVTPAKFFAEWVKDPAGLQRVTHEVWQMKKLDLAKLEKAFAAK